MALANAIFEESGGRSIEAFSQRDAHQETDQGTREAEGAAVAGGLVSRIIAGGAIVFMALMSPDWDGEDISQAGTKKFNMKLIETSRFSVL